MSDNPTDDRPRGYTPPKNKPTPRRGQQRAQVVKRTNRRHSIQWAVVVVAVIVVIGLLLLINDVA